MLIPFLLGARWAPAAPILAWLTLVALHRPISMTMNFVFVSQGRTQGYVLWSLFNVTTSLAAFAIGLHWGAVGVAAAYGLSDLFIRMPFLWWRVTRTGPVKLIDLYRTAAPFAAGCVAAFAAAQIAQYFAYPNTIVQLGVSGAVGYAAAWTTLLFFKDGRETVVDTFRTVAHELPRFLPFLRRRQT